MHRNRWLVILAVAATFALGACSSRTLVESDLGIKGAPDWVNEGTQVLDDHGGRRFHGVGQAPPMGDESLQIATADNRARAELAQILTSYLDVVSSDYTAASGSQGDTVAEQAVSRQIHNLSQVNLSGARILGHWKDEKSGVVYSVAELDLKQVQTSLDAVENMNEDLKMHIRDRGQNIFDRYREERK
ncbi:MAG: hypothetical protein P1P84_04155 [Deferrisomatales bacterium]|nr:hypothetical protein [Deferrisomatales bacterium]